MNPLRIESAAKLDQIGYTYPIFFAFSFGWVGEKDENKNQQGNKPLLMGSYKDQFSPFLFIKI